MASEFEQLLANLRTFADEKLGEIELKHQGHLAWLEGKALEFKQAIDAVTHGSKDGGFKVPKTPKRRKGGRGGNDESAPPGQDSALQLPAAVKKGRALKEEATPAVRKSTRHQQNVLREIPVTAAGGSGPTATCAETPLQAAPRSGGRPSSRNSSRPPAQEENGQAGLETDIPSSDLGPVSPNSAADSVQEGAAEEKVEVAATESEVVRESLERGGNTPLAIDPTIGEESGRAPAGEEIASKDAEEERAVLTRRGRPDAAGQKGSAKIREEVANKGGSRKRKAKQETEEAHAEDEEVSPAGEASLLQAEEVPIHAPETVAQQPEPEQKSAVVDEAATADEGAEKEESPPVVQPNVRVTRRMQKAMGGELEALPSGLADGNEGKTKRAGRGRKNRRRDLDESAIREQALKQEMEPAPETESTVEVEPIAETYKKEGVIGRGDASVRGEVTPTKQGGGETGREGVPPREEDAAKGVDLENATIPETPQERPVQRPQRAARARKANVDVPGGRVTRARKEKGQPDADVSEGRAGALSTEKGTDEGAAGPVKDADASIQDDVIDGQQMEEQVTVQEAEEEALVKKKGVKKPAKGKKKPKGGKQQVVEATSEKEVVNEIEDGHESAGAEQPILSPGGEAAGRQVRGSDKSKEDDHAEKEVIEAVQTAGPVSSPPEVPSLEQSPLASATPAPTGPLKVRETRSASAKKATAEDNSLQDGSPGHQTPKLCLSTSTPQEKGASEGSPPNVAFGSPIKAAPDSGVKRSGQRNPDSPSSISRSASKPLESTPAADHSVSQQVDVAGDVTLTIPDVAASRTRSISELLAEVSPLLRPQVVGRITRSGSKGPDSDSKLASTFLSPTQKATGRVTRSGSQAPVSGGRETRSTLSPAKDVVGRVTRSALGGKSSSGKLTTSPPGSFSLKSNPPKDADRIGGSGKRTRDMKTAGDEATPVPNQGGLAALSPEKSGLTAGSAGLAAGNAEKRTPGTGGVLTRSQGKLRRSADVIPSPSSSPEILAGDLSGVLLSPSTILPQKPAPTLSQNTPPQTQASPAIQGPGVEAKPQNQDGVVAKTAVGAAAVSGARRSVGKETKGIPLSDSGFLSEPESPPTVDMDVCTTPFTAGSRKVPRPVTGKRNALGQKKESAGGEGFRGLEVQGGTSAQKGVESEKGKGDVMIHLRRSPRLQRGQETDMTSAEQEADVRSPPGTERGASVRKSERIKERSAKKMRLSAGFAVGFGSELIDLENEDEDLMEANFEVNSDGIRRSARKAADQTAKSLAFDGEEGPGKNRLSFGQEPSKRAAELSPNVRKVTPRCPKGDSAFRFSAKKPIRSVKKSARKKSSGRPSFVSASEDGSDGAGFGGLEAGLDGGGTVRQKTPAKRSNLIASGFSSFLSFMTKKEPAGPPIPGNNKNTVKGSVKALEAAEAARKEEAKRAEERERRKALLDKRREEKLKDLAAGAAQVKAPTTKAVEPAPEKRPVPPSSAVTSTVTDQKLRRANEFRSKLEDEKAKRLEEDLRKKDEERRKKEADAARRKRQREDEERRERDEKRRRLEDALKTRKEGEEKQRVELEEKERKRKQQEEAERKQKATEEEERRRRRKEKELEAERRRKEEEEKRVAKLKEREEDRKRQEGLFVRRKEDERNEKMMRPTGPRPLTPIKTYLAENAASARHSPFLGSEKIMPPPKTTPSRYNETAAQNQYTAASLPANPASRILNSASGYASSSLAAKPSGLQITKAVNPPSNLRVTGWEDRAAKAKPNLPGPLVHKDARPCVGKEAPNSAQAREKLRPNRARTPPPAETVESYEISPFKEESSDEEEEEDEGEAKKPIPAWARKENLGPSLRRQMGIDPDDVFQNLSVKTCSLDQVFGTKGSKKKKDFGRRSSSGNWLEDRLTWKEELQYKKGMGYLKTEPF